MRLASMCAWTMSAVAMWGVASAEAEEIVVKPVILQAVAQSEVPAVQEGQIKQILVREGDSVASGKVIIQQDERLALLRRDMASIEKQVAIKKVADRAELTLAEVEMKVANANLQRALASRRRFPDTPSQAEVDELELRLAQAQQHRDKAELDLELAAFAEQLATQSLEAAELQLDLHAIKSPVAGIITEMIARQGDWVRPGQILARVVQMDRLKAEGRLVYSNRPQQLLGAQVRFSTDGQSEREEHLGTIIFVSPEIDPNDGSRRIVAEIANDQQILNPGQRGQLLIRTP